jgi:uncharacterized membrane protein
MFKFAGRTFLAGLITILPVVLTLYLIYWMAVSTESVLGRAIRTLLPENLYWPGMGLIAGLIAVFAVGVLMHVYVVQWLFTKGEQIFYHVPVINSVYRAIRDLFDYFSPTTKRKFERVVAVSIGDSGMQLIGFVTQEDPDSMPEDFRENDSVLVYFPLSYMIGGYTLLVPRSAVRPIKMRMEQAMRFTLTAGVTGVANPGRR